MSDTPGPDLQQRIAAVMQDHAYMDYGRECGCGTWRAWRNGEPNGCHEEHVAAVLVDELGLTQPVIASREQLKMLPNMSVVQFRGAGLGERNRLVWQLDEEWFSPGAEWSMPHEAVPEHAFPAVVLWVPGGATTNPRGAAMTDLRGRWDYLLGRVDSAPNWWGWGWGPGHQETAEFKVLEAFFSAAHGPWSRRMREIERVVTINRDGWLITFTDNSTMEVFP